MRRPTVAMREPLCNPVVHELISIVGCEQRPKGYALPSPIPTTHYSRTTVRHFLYDSRHRQLLRVDARSL